MPKDSDLKGIYLTKSIEDSWDWINRMRGEGYSLSEVYFYEVELEPSQVFHPRYTGNQVEWVRWDGNIDLQTKYVDKFVPCFNNYEQFVHKFVVKCKQINEENSF
jgi:hypothetical protein